MSEGSPRPAILTVLAEIGEARTRAEAEVAAIEARIARDEESTKRAIEEAQRRLSALRDERDALSERRVGDVAEADRRERSALRDGLAMDREILDDRATLLAKAEAERRAAVEARLRDPEVAVALEELEGFDASAVAALPPGYRKVVEAHHARMRALVDPILADLHAPLPPLGGEPVGVCALFATDPPEGTPEALVAVLPVPYSVFRDWDDRPEDLSSLLAYRVVAAITRVLGSVAAQDAPIQYLELHGCLAVQVWLGDVEVKGELRERVLEEVEALREAAVELGTARIELYGLWVRPAMLVDEEGE